MFHSHYIEVLKIWILTSKFEIQMFLKSDNYKNQYPQHKQKLHKSISEADEEHGAYEAAKFHKDWTTGVDWTPETLCEKRLSTMDSIQQIYATKLNNIYYTK